MMPNQEERERIEADNLSKRAGIIKRENIPKYSNDEIREMRNVVGLVNLGNTCFMSASLQCLAQVSELNDFLLTGQWEEQLNATNPIGTGGALLLEYIKLLAMMKTSQKPVRPKEFHKALGKFNQHVGFDDLVRWLRAT